ncbi:MAG: GNAT family N-acetyltransferase [Rhodospirillales bacterium]|nr:GNAT family N-acetyltransferase [Rhodospirillales bacterium]MDE2576097.1 GNAT family N-acetyltransferase [Rhodospirillales bacterium]
MRPVGWEDLADLVALKGDPRVFAVMLGGVRTPVQVAEELAAEIAFWGARGFGMWAVRGAEGFLGYVGLHERADGRGIALRFAFVAGAQGRGYASEAGGAALRFGHDRGGLARIVAVARASNVASRQVLGAIGMTESAAFDRDGERMLEYHSVR